MGLIKFGCRLVGYGVVAAVIGLGVGYSYGYYAASAGKEHRITVTVKQARTKGLTVLENIVDTSYQAIKSGIEECKGGEYENE